MKVEMIQFKVLANVISLSSFHPSKPIKGRREVFNTILMMIQGKFTQKICFHSGTTQLS